jgi:hypothetical protein
MEYLDKTHGNPWLESPIDAATSLSDILSACTYIIGGSKIYPESTEFD